MAAIGRNAAVVQMLGGRTMKGHKAQFAWRTVHLALLPTNEDRAKAVVDWAGSELTHQRVGRISVGPRRVEREQEGSADVSTASTKRRQRSRRTCSSSSGSPATSPR